MLVIANVLLIVANLFFLPEMSVTQNTSTELQTNISGQIILDDSWEPIVYLSHIPTFDQRNEISSQMIIAKADIDSLGNFSMELDFLSEEFQLYRFHVVKRQDNPATLIIGGKNENHFFTVLNNSTQLVIRNDSSSPPFSNVDLEGEKASQSFHKIDNLYKTAESEAELSTASMRELINDKLMSDLLITADTTGFIMTSLYAVHLHKNKSNWGVDQYYNYLDKWQNSTNPYMKELSPNNQLSRINLWLVTIVLGLILTSIGIFAYKKLNSNDKALLKDLSVQERRIFALLQEGKTNQEISDEFNISISTVKTHVSNIYAKLNIASRKEAMNFLD